ncbi:MAG: hypothetical protein GWO07_02575 [Candidatus Dadabacteria bacterium]|nr:hypothetical protein [Candidatus Dadabacteria bacterium]NIS07652.1 hypothetical protein [Candidatus Dadabacteria bacterium]NIV42199.1 hypothetical protein [Candidatus Dadabacteria bacterium]NIX14745.1 hypothetical protein [Candidatus Dadabacteria bacterium]NIY21288.1 hypothetical protein [Candidatus Dadabacteria bacterium]
MKRKYARMFSRQVSNEGVKYMIDEIKDMTYEEALKINRENNGGAIWIPIPEGLYDKWVKNLYIGDKKLLKQ